MNKFFEMINRRWDAGARVCIGLDSDAAKLPERYRRSEPLQALFNEHIVEITGELALAFKINIAFYSGRHGLDQLIRTVHSIRKIAPEVPIILDAKRADIGNTNRGYVAEAFIEIGADAVTVSPYFGKEAMLPFLEQRDKGIIVLCRTSNPGSDEFQKRLTEAKDYYELTGKDYIPSYLLVTLHVAHEWNEFGNCGLVIGATYPEEMAEVRRYARDIPFLAPGVDTQGADIEQTVRAGMDYQGQGLIINSSSGIIFASSGPDFAEAAYRKTIDLTSQIDHALNLLV